MLVSAGECGLFKHLGQADAPGGRRAWRIGARRPGTRRFDVPAP